MRAYQLFEYSGPDGLRLAEVANPQPSAEEVVVDVHAIGVNYPDLLMTRGEYQYRPELPVVPGCEVAGIVSAAPRTSPWRSGDRVAGFVWHGGFADQVAVPLNNLVRVPDSVDFASGAAMVVNYHTAHFALAHRGRLEPGESVMVMGAGGGIGTAGLQVARGLGAARVIAGVADDAQAEIARSAGADEVVLLEENFAGHVIAVNGAKGVDVVLDPLGDWLFGEAIRALAPAGRVLVVGFAAGAVPTVKVNRLLLRNVSVVGVAFGAYLDIDATLMQTQSASLDAMIAAGQISPEIGMRCMFEDLPAALNELWLGNIRGKAVVEMDRVKRTTPAGDIADHVDTRSE